MFHGQHTLEEIAWHEGLERSLLAELLEYYDAHLATLVTPAEGDAFEEEDEGPQPAEAPWGGGGAALAAAWPTAAAGSRPKVIPSQVEPQWPKAQGMY